MNKKTITSIITLSLCFCLGMVQIATAEEGIMLVSDDIPVEGTVNVDEIDDSEDEPTTIINTEAIATDAGSEPESEVTINYNGTSGEAEVVCASADEPGCADETVDSEIWPLYLSLGALGITILLVFIINLIGHHKK